MQEAPGRSLTGTIPPLSLVATLEYLYSVPSCILFHQCKYLSLLYFSDINDNNIQGTIPDLEILGNLYYLEVGNNQLSGVLPSVSGNSALKVFHGRNNDFSGFFPSLAANLNLESLSFDFNAQLAGTISPLLSHSKLQLLSVFLPDRSRLFTIIR